MDSEPGVGACDAKGAEASVQVVISVLCELFIREVGCCITVQD